AHAAPSDPFCIMGAWGASPQIWIGREVNRSGKQEGVFRKRLQLEVIEERQVRDAEVRQVASGDDREGEAQVVALPTSPTEQRCPVMPLPLTQAAERGGPL